MNCTKRFTSKQSRDILEVSYNTKSHNALFTVVQLDKVTDNSALLVEIIEFLKQNDIKWIILNINHHFDIPENAVWYKNKKTGNVHCHIEDFDKFYLKNLTHFITPAILYLESDAEKEDGWIKVVDKKKERKTKMAAIKKELTELNSDWNKL